MALFSGTSVLLAGARARVGVVLIPVALLWLGVLWAAYGGRAPNTVTTAAPLPPVLQTVATSGERSPAQGSFDHFDIEGRAIPAAANRRNDIAFIATLHRSSAEEGLFLSSEGRLTKLAAAGDAVPSGERIAGFGERPAAAINEAGAVAFAATLTGGKATSGIFLSQRAKLSAIALSGAAAPDVSGGTLAEFESPVVNDQGEVGFLAALRRGRETGEAIYLYRRGQLTKLVANGDPAPGGGIFSSFGNPALNNKGEIAFGALIDQGPILGGIFLKSGKEIHLVVAAGSAAPTGGIFARFSERLDLNDAGAIAFSAVLRQGGPGSAMFVAENDTPRMVAALGDAAPGGGSYVGFASWPAMSQAGNIAFIASIDGGANALAIYLIGAGGGRRLATVGDTLPDGSRLASFPLYPALSISPSDAVTFSATAERDGTRNDTLFFYGPQRSQR